MKKSSNISATALHRFIPQPASGRSSALPCLAAFLVWSKFLWEIHLHSLFFIPGFRRVYNYTVIHYILFFDFFQYLFNNLFIFMQCIFKIVCLLIVIYIKHPCQVFIFCAFILLSPSFQPSNLTFIILHIQI